jgi:hypothetical protein
VFFGESLSAAAIATAVRGGGWLVTTRCEPGSSSGQSHAAGHDRPSSQDGQPVHLVFARAEGIEETVAPPELAEGLTRRERLAVWAAAWAAGMTPERIVAAE